MLMKIGWDCYPKGELQMTIIKDIFNRKKKYATIPSEAAKNVPEGIMTKCPECRQIILTKELMKLHKVCPHCDHHFKMTA